MKARSYFTISMVASVVLAASAVCRGGEDSVSEKPSEQSTKNLLREPLGELAKISDVLEKEVKNLQGEKLGRLEEVAVDVESGRIVYVVLASGKETKSPEKNVAVVSRSMRWDHANGVLRIDVSQDKVQAAPTFSLSQWEDSSRSNHVVELYAYYDLRPYFLEHYEGKRVVPPVTPLHQVARASKVVGMPVRNQQGEKMGSVENLMINLERGRIAHVIVSSGGFLGLGDELSVMPATAFRYDPAEKVLRVDATKDDLAHAPHFKNSEWPDLNDPRYADRVYRAYHVEPYFATDAVTDPTGRNAPDRVESHLTPLDQGSSPADRNTTQSIRRELIAQENLSINARNVKIITADGQVTLRGPVNSEDEKRLVASIAARAVSPDRVNNQLEVKRQTN